MKKTIYSLLVLTMFSSSVFSQRTIVVKNNLAFDRKEELVEVKLPSAMTQSFILKNNEGIEIPYQKVGKSILFQSSVNANSSSIYWIVNGKPSSFAPKTSARFVPERKDDMSWENDIAAYRMYGPALAKENPSNGIDMWVKRTSEVFMDKMYYDELQNKKSYHIDRGQGMDCYKVGHTLGAGGIAPYVSDSLYVGNQFSSYKIIEVGPLRSSFQLTYDSVKVGNKFYKQEITITVNAGSIFNKAEVKFIGPSNKIELATGIFLHDGKGNLKLNATNGTIAYAEDAVSEFKLPSGRNYVGVFVPVQTNKAIRKGVHGLLTTNYTIGNKFTYYFGGGWNKWKFPTDDDWFKAINQGSESIKHPLLVKFK